MVGRTSRRPVSLFALAATVSVFAPIPARASAPTRDAVMMFVFTPCYWEDPFPQSS